MTCDDNRHSDVISDVKSEIYDADHVKDEVCVFHSYYISKSVR